MRTSSIFPGKEILFDGIFVNFKVKIFSGQVPLLDLFFHLYSAYLPCFLVLLHDVLSIGVLDVHFDGYFFDSSTFAEHFLYQVLFMFKLHMLVVPSSLSCFVSQIHQIYTRCICLRRLYSYHLLHLNFVHWLGECLLVVVCLYHLLIIIVVKPRNMFKTYSFKLKINKLIHCLLP